jgi:hypothetical protein
MAMILRVQTMHSVADDPTQEWPYSKMRTTGVFVVPNDFDYGALCDDSTNVEVIAENVPADIELGFWGSPTPKRALKDEGELSDIILENFHLLTCFNCGEKLGDVKSNYRTGGEEAGVLCIDPGSINYPREPDEPAAAYFECVECQNNRKKSTGGQSDGSKR